MKITKTLLIGALSVTASSFVFAADSVDSDLFNQQFLEAMKTRESGDIFASIEILEKLINSQPQYKRAELELAVSYFRASLYSQAKTHANHVLNDPNTPPQVKETIEVFLSQLNDIEEAESKNRHSFEGSLGVGIGHDTNINASPTDSIININGAEFALASNSTAQEENYGSINLQFNHTYRVPGTLGIGSRPVNMEWTSSIALYRKAYQDTGDFNLDVATFITGANFISRTDWRAGINLRLDHISLGNEKLAHFVGLNANYTKVDKANQYTITGELTNQEYESELNKGRDGIKYGLGLEMQHQFDQEFLGKIGLNYALNDAKDDNKQYTSKLANVALYYSMTKNSLLFGQAQYKVVDYDGVEPVYNIGRNDSEVSAVIGATYIVPSGYFNEWIINGKISRYNNTSDVSIYEYERTDASLEVSKRF
ncbi:MAG: DUF2860 family protein [Thiomicrorhabdus sp.]|nr:DUF2860 family protein [Thiomicrorhabdus sp.]